MGLQSCATIEYIITEIEGKAHPSAVGLILKRNDFNTYLWAGLRRGDRSGLVAIKAAFLASTPYLYFQTH